MLTPSCTYVRGQLSAFHDEELPVAEQIAIAGHVEDCPVCAVEAEDLRAIREALRGAAAAIQSGWNAELSGLQSAILGRLKAEEDESFVNRAGRLLDDPRRLWATGGAVVASTMCAFLIVGVLAEVANDHPNSLAAIVQAMARAEQARADGPVVPPRADADAVMPAAVMSQGEGEDVVSVFTAVVTPDGDLEDVELLQARETRKGGPGRTGQLTSDLLAAAATARFEPARLAGAPVAVNVVWLLTHTTVRGKLLHGRARPQTS